VSALLLAVLWFSVGRYQQYVEASTRTKLSSLEYMEESEFDSLIKILGEQAVETIRNKLFHKNFRRSDREGTTAACTK